MARSPADLLARSPFLRGLSPELLSRLALRLRPLQLARGDLVFHEGDPARSMFVVESGELVAIQSGGGDGQSVQLRRFREGDHVGATALVDLAPRPATVVASAPSRLYELTDTELFALCRESPKEYVLVLENVVHELCRQLRRASSRSPGLALEAEDLETTDLEAVSPRH